eukprot:gene30540-52692_t
MIKKINSKSFGLFWCLLLASLWPCAALAQMPPAGAPSAAPAWSLPVWTAQGASASRLAMADLKGQWVYLDFWASWCGPCKQSFPWMGRLQKDMHAAPLQVVAIGLDKQAAPMQQFLKQAAPEFQVVWDPAGETARQFGVQAMPSSYLINPQGRVVWRHQGFQSATAAELQAKIKALVS